MTHLFISVFTTILLVCLDVILRRDLINDNLPDYLAVCILLVGLVFCSRFILGKLNHRKLRLIFSFIFILLFSVIFWIQSAVYTVYFQFISAADLGIIFGNLNYWSQGSDSLLAIINLNYLFAYLIIFSLAFLPVADLPWIKQINHNAIAILSGLIFIVVMFSSAIYIKQNQLYFLTTPIMSLVYEFKKFFSEKDRFMKTIADDSSEGFYPRENDAINNFQRRGDFNVILLLLESMRQDHMSLYGYERDTTPYQRTRFEKAIHFKHAISNATSTDTSAETIFTGMDQTNPKIHETSLLWSYLKAAHLNQFYVGSHWLQWNGWFGRAFLSEDLDSIQAPLAVDASLTGYDMVTARKFKKTLSEFASKDEPFFAVVHFAGTHYPYVAPEEYHHWLPADDKFEPARLNEIINKYDNSIAYNDAAVATVIKELDNLNLGDNTIIIATADHAEAMYEHKQFFHGKVFWQEGIHVPLYIDIPNTLLPLFSEQEINSLNTNTDLYVSSVDLFPTILDLYDIPIAKPVDGYSLLKPYPEEIIKVYMIPEEYALIHSHTGEKYHVDNSKKILRYTQLRKDPDEQNFTKTRLNKFISINEMIEKIESNQDLKQFSVSQ